MLSESLAWAHLLRRRGSHMLRDGRPSVLRQLRKAVLRWQVSYVQDPQPSREVVLDEVDVAIQVPA